MSVLHVLYGDSMQQPLLHCGNDSLTPQHGCWTLDTSACPTCAGRSVVIRIPAPPGRRNQCTLSWSRALYMPRYPTTDRTPAALHVSTQAPTRTIIVLTDSEQYRARGRELGSLQSCDVTATLPFSRDDWPVTSCMRSKVLKFTFLDPGKRSSPSRALVTVPGTG